MSVPTRVVIVDYYFEELLAQVSVLDKKQLKKWSSRIHGSNNEFMKVQFIDGVLQVYVPKTKSFQLLIPHSLSCIDMDMTEYYNTGKMKYLNTNNKPRQHTIKVPKNTCGGY